MFLQVCLIQFLFCYQWVCIHKLQNFPFFIWLDIQLVPRVLLSHIPLYRRHDTYCGSYRSSPIINQVSFVWFYKVKKLSRIFSLFIIAVTSFFQVLWIHVPYWRLWIWMPPCVSFIFSGNFIFCSQWRNKVRFLSFLMQLALL